MRMRLATLVLATCLLAFTGTSCGASSTPTLTVAAAADLRFAFEDIAEAFEDECACQVILSFGSSGQFAAQIEQGLPVDVFASANISYVDDLDENGLILEGSQQLYGIGRVVLATPADSAIDPSNIDVLRDPAVDQIAIANPDHAPYGVAAKEALLSLGLWDELQPKLVLGENASQTTQFIESGDAAAGIIPLSLAIQREGSLRYALIDEGLHNPLEQAAAVVARSAEPELGRQFIEFVNGPTGRPIMQAYGFVLQGKE
jgi:molybdate transport system substrate-binding protein